MGLLETVEKLLYQENSSKDDSNQFLIRQAFETNDQFEDWAEKFNVVTGIINNLIEETDECIMFQNEIENEIKNTNLELEELESRKCNMDKMLRYNLNNFEMYTKQHDQLREASNDLITKCVYKFNDEEEVKNIIGKLHLLDKIEGTRNKVSKHIERFAKEDTESLGMVEKEITQVKSRLQQLESHRLYTENMMKKNIIVLADLVKKQHKDLLFIRFIQRIGTRIDVL